MSKKIDRQALIEAVNSCKDLNEKQKGDLCQLLNETPYGLVWEDTPEEVYNQLKTEIPVIREDKSKAIVNGNDFLNHVIIEGDNVRLGSILGSVSTMPQRKEAKYLLLYDIENPESCELFELLKKHEIRTRKELVDDGYPYEDNKKDDLEYFIYRIKGELIKFNIDVEEFNQILRHNEKGAPYYTELEHLIL